MLSFHEAGAHKATVAVTEYTHTVPFGVAEIENERIKDMVEKPTAVWWANAGIYCLSPDVAGRVKPEVETPMTQLIGDCISLGESVGAFRILGDWLDIGRPDELKRAHRGWGGHEARHQTDLHHLCASRQQRRAEQEPARGGGQAVVGPHRAARA